MDLKEPLLPLLAPSEGPDNVRVELLQHNRILVNWDPLPDEHANGQLHGYTVYLRHYNNRHDENSGERFNVSSSETQILLDGLDGGRKYSISVTAFTTKEGPRSDWKTVIVGKFVLLEINQYE